MTDSSKTEAGTVKVTVRTVYGNDLIYPVCENAQSFAAIAVKSTLSRSDLSHIRSLGFKVVEVVNSKLDEVTA